MPPRLSPRSPRRTPPRRLLAAFLLLASAGLVLLPTVPAHALTDAWAEWGDLSGTSNNYRTEMRQQAPGFPLAGVTTDSRSNVQVPGGVSTFLGAGTPPGAKYGTSQGSPYLALRPKADNASAPSVTTYTFEAPTPDTGWAFVLGDVDSDQVRVAATDENGDTVSPSTIDGWFQGTFNSAGAADLPSWDADSSTLVGNPTATDTNGASGWFEPDVRLSSLTLTFTRRAGFPVYQTWFVSRARPLGGVVDVVSGSCALDDTMLTLVSPSGEVLGTTSPGPGGQFEFGEHATQGGYVVRITAPDGCVVLGGAQQVLSNRGNDNDPASRAAFDIRAIVPQPISGAVLDTDGEPVAGVEVTLSRPGGGSVTTTTGEDGTYLFDENDVDTGYSLSIEVPDGYVAGPDGTTIDGIEVDDVPITDQDFVVRRQASLSGTVTGGGGGLGGVQVVLTPDGGGAAITTVTRADGSYVLDGVPAGDYTLSIVPPDGFTGDTSRPVNLGTADLGGQDFALSRPGAVSGEVSDADTGEPLPGVEVVVDGPGEPVVVETDDDGRYFVDDLAEGSYTVTPSPPPGTEPSGPASCPFTITDAGEIRSGCDFAFQVVGQTATPTPTATASPTTAAPTTGAASPGVAVPTAVDGGAAGARAGGSGGGWPLWPAALAGALLVTSGLVLGGRGLRHRRH